MTAFQLLFYISAAMLLWLVSGIGVAVWQRPVAYRRCLGSLSLSHEHTLANVRPPTPTCRCGGFPFDPETMTLHLGIASVMAELGTLMDGQALALWCAEPNEALRGQSPVQAWRDR